MHQLRQLAMVAALLGPAVLQASPAAGEAAAAPLRVAVLAYRPKPLTLAQWTPLAAYLEGTLGRPVVVEAYDRPELERVAARRQADVILTSPGLFVLLRHTAGLSPPIATLVVREGPHVLRSYGGVIFTRADRGDIASLADVAGKRVAAAELEAFGGYEAQSFELVEAGVRLPKRDRLLLTGLPQDRVVAAILDGRADVGFVRSGVVEALAREGALDPRRVKILNRQARPELPYAVSTRLYPEWPVAVTPELDPRLASRLAAALLALPSGSFRGPAAAVEGFDVPADYAGVEEVLRRLELPPFDRPPEIGLGHLWRRYAPWLTALAALLGCVAAAGVGLVVLYRRSLSDVARRRLAEEEVRRLNQQLERRVAERTAQLETANQELESFAYSVSHDLRAPLRHVDGYVELLLKRLGGADPSTRQTMSRISEAARRMSQLIDDLLSFSRMGRGELSRQPVDLGALVRDVRRELEPEARGRVVRWRQAALPVVTGDPTLLRVALVNLVSNALKYTRPRPEAEVEIGSQEGQGETVVFVRDNGVGFDMRYVDKLFGVFQRLHGAAEFEGNGIGLASVRRIVARHGGRTWAEGQIDRGATFFFSLPRAAPDRDEAPPRAPARPEVVPAAAGGEAAPHGGAAAGGRRGAGAEVRPHPPP